MYRRICEALRPGGVFLNGDYMVESEEEERVLMDECARCAKEQGTPEDVFVHFDTSLAVDAEIELLKHVGFACVEKIWRREIPHCCALCGKRVARLLPVGCPLLLFNMKQTRPKASPFDGTGAVTENH